MEELASSVLASCAAMLAVAAARGVARPGPPELADARDERDFGSRLRRSLKWLGRLGLVQRLAGTTLAAGPFDAEELAGLRFLSGSAGGLCGLLGPVPFSAPLLFYVGTRLSGFALARIERRRRRAIDAEIPQFLDALAAASSAGLSAPLAMRRASEAIGEPLAGEFERVSTAVDLGARWREELHALADRLALPDLSRVVVALTRTETLGSSLSSATAELASRVRRARRDRATERARTAPVKMLFPLVFLVLPAFLLLTVVPVLLTTLKSIR